MGFNSGFKGLTDFNHNLNGKFRVDRFSGSHDIIRLQTDGHEVFNMHSRRYDNTPRYGWRMKLNIQPQLALNVRNAWIVM